MSEKPIDELSDDTVYLLTLFYLGAMQIQETGNDDVADVAVAYMKTLSRGELISVIADLSAMVWSNYAATIHNPEFEVLARIADGPQ